MFGSFLTTKIISSLRTRVNVSCPVLRGHQQDTARKCEDESFRLTGLNGRSILARERNLKKAHPEG